MKNIKDEIINISTIQKQIKHTYKNNQKKISNIIYVYKKQYNYELYWKEYKIREQSSSIQYYNSIDKTIKENNLIVYDWKFNNDNIIKNKINLTLLHILYNIIRKKTKGHTQNDTEYIKKNETYWNSLLKRMEISQEILESYYVN